MGPNPIQTWTIILRVFFLFRYLKLFRTETAAKQEQNRNRNQNTTRFGRSKELGNSRCSNKSGYAFNYGVVCISIIDLSSASKFESLEKEETRVRAANEQMNDKLHL